MGYAGTMGASFIDYLISDHVTSPQDHFELYTEKIAQMPHSYFVNDHKQTYPPHFDSKVCPNGMQKARKGGQA